jgi:hypothetical protein
MDVPAMANDFRSPRDLHWSPAEKKIARAAFDAALAREKAAARRSVEALLEQSDDPDQIWEIHRFLDEKQRDLAEKYDYRYSVLTRVFRRLVNEGWLGPADLSGLGTDKLALILGDLTTLRP